MQSKTVITSFSVHGYALYGRQFIETFHNYWPIDVRLAVFVEDGQPPMTSLIPAARDFIVEPLDNVLRWKNFYDGIKRFRMMCGDTGRGYSIQYDARMARKTFMEDYALKRFGGKVFWVDADSVTHSRVPDDFLDRVLPDDKFCCFLGRENFYTESGFLGFNYTHKLADQFFKYYTEYFESGMVFTLKGWHDCYVFDEVRVGCPRDAFNNIGAGVDPGPGRQVFINSELGAYMDHLKGDRKSAGRSPLSDLTIKRTEPYWQEAAEVQTR